MENDFYLLNMDEFLIKNEKLIYTFKKVKTSVLR